jgi:hypothetical protein
MGRGGGWLSGLQLGDRAARVADRIGQRVALTVDWEADREFRHVFVGYPRLVAQEWGRAGGGLVVVFHVEGTRAKVLAFPIRCVKRVDDPPRPLVDVELVDEPQPVDAPRDPMGGGGG